MPVPTWARRWALRVLALPAGVLVALAFPAVSWWWLGWVGLVPVVLLLASASSYRDAALRSALAAVGFFLTFFHWVLPDVGVVAPAIAVVAGVMWVPFGIATYRLLRDPSALRVALAMVVLPSVWVAVEVVRSRDELGGAFGVLGLSQWQVPPVLAIASIGGVWLFSFVLVAVNVGITVAVLPRAGRVARWTGGGVAAALVGVVVGYGLLRPEPAATGHARIIGVQVGVVHDGAERFDTHVELTRRAAGRGQDVVVWGQSSMPFDPRSRPEAVDRLRETARAIGGDILVNVDARAPDGRIRKTTQQYGPDGLVAEYVKRRLVPFGEYVPLRGLLGGILGGTDIAEEDRAPGGKPTVLRVNGVRVGPLISYESVFPDLRAELVRLGAEVTVVQGSLVSFHGTWAQPQQASAEAVRAVETGRSAVLVQMNGPTVAFDARGRQLAWAPREYRGLVTVDVPLYEGTTPYVRLGNWVPTVSIVVTVLAAFAAVVLSVYRRSNAAQRSRDA